MTELLLDAAGRRRSPATMAGFHAGRPPRNKGQRYPADPPTVAEIVAVMRAAGDGRHGCRLRGLIVVLWRAGLRIHEALALNESDLDHRRGALLVRRGRGRPPPRGRYGRVGLGAPAALDRCAPRAPGRPVVLRHQRPDPRTTMVARRRACRAAPHGGDRRRSPAFRAAPTAPRPRRRAGTRGRAAHRHPAPTGPQQPRHHLDLLQGIDNAEIIDAVHARHAPMVPVSASLRL